MEASEREPAKPVPNAIEELGETRSAIESEPAEVTLPENDTSRLKAKIVQSIANSEQSGWAGSSSLSSQPLPEGDRKAITFEAYMAMCLYDERNGYYRSGTVRVGKNGDFYTSSAIGSLMGEKLAAYISELANVRDEPALIMEWGAGTGTLSRQMLEAWRNRHSDWLASNAALVVVDGNPVHLAEARKNVGYPGNGVGACEELIGNVAFLLPEEAESLLAASKSQGDEGVAIVIANELVDAFPVHRVVMKEGKLWELGVAVDDIGSGDGESPDGESMGTLDKSAGSTPLRYVYMPLSDPRIASVLERDGVSLRENQIFEVNLQAESWIAKMAELVGRGYLILIDYGHEAGELAAAHRMNGTLLCYSGHVAQDEPFLRPGEQDMTAHVNFTACRASAATSGWSTRYYGTQKQFLVDQGLLSELVAHDGTDPFGPAAKRNRAIRQLLLSDSMSETFKVLTLAIGEH